jgi:hypothetical protein
MVGERYCASQRQSILTSRGYGDVIAPASATYLHSLSVEILRTWAEFFLIDTDAVDDEETMTRLAYLCFELRRFLENPDLFPSDEARARFLAAVSLDPEMQFFSACAGLLIKSELDAIRKDTEQDYTRPTYANDVKGWENFLLNMAPGGPSDPTDRAHTAPKTSLQLLPPVGMRIISDIEREEREIERYVEIKKDEGYDVTAASTTMMIDFNRKAKATTTLPLMSMPQQTFDATVRQNPFRPVRPIELSSSTR